MVPAPVAAADRHQVLVLSKDRCSAEGRLASKLCRRIERRKGQARTLPWPSPKCQRQQPRRSAAGDQQESSRKVSERHPGQGNVVFRAHGRWDSISGCLAAEAVPEIPQPAPGAVARPSGSWPRPVARDSPLCWRAACYLVLLWPPGTAPVRPLRQAETQGDGTWPRLVLPGSR